MFNFVRVCSPVLSSSHDISRRTSPANAPPAYAGYTHPTLRKTLSDRGIVAHARGRMLPDISSGNLTNKNCSAKNIYMTTPSSIILAILRVSVFLWITTLSGTTAIVSISFFGTLENSQPFSGVIEYTTPGSDSSSTVNYGSYRFQGSQIASFAELNLPNGQVFVPTTNVFDIFVGDNRTSSLNNGLPYDRFEVEGFFNPVSSVGSGDFFYIGLLDAAATAFSSDSLPTTMRASSFSSRNLTVVQGGNFIRGTIDGFTVIPELSSIFLVGFGLMYSSLLRVRSCRNKNS